MTNYKSIFTGVSVLGIISFVLLGLLFLSFVTQGFTINPFISVEKAVPVKKAMDYLNNSQFFGGQKVVLTEAKWLGSVYHIKFKIENSKDQPFEGYVTKDGSLLFPSAYEIKPVAKETKTAPQAEVKLFTMAFCPFGNQAEANIIPVINLLKDKVEIEPHYIIYSDYPNGQKEQFKDYCWDESGKYCSMHGKGELHQDVRELCVYKYQKDKYWDFVAAINKECAAENVDECWSKVAQEKGIDAIKVDDCYKNEALNLLAQEKQLNDEYQANGSPMLFINKELYDGGRNPESYKKAICDGFDSKTRPAACETKLPETDVTSGSGGSCG